MYIVSNYEMKHKGNEIWVAATEDVRCPYCKGGLKLCDNRRRKVKNGDGDIVVYMLRRMWCVVCQCSHREIPDTIQPRKHYSSEVIQSVLDGDDSACAADNSTIYRWRVGMEASKADIEQRIEAEYAKQAGRLPPLATRTALQKIKATITAWLAYVMKLLINAGHRIYNQFAFCPRTNPPRIEVCSTNNLGGGDTS